MTGVYDDTEIKRRKEEGIFYTPEYITDFICRSTIIPYLSMEGAENVNDLISEYLKDIDKLENKLKSLRILDPACGCGVFLIKATDLLFEITKEIKIVKEFGGEYEKIKYAITNNIHIFPIDLSIFGSLFIFNRNNLNIT